MPTNTVKEAADQPADVSNISPIFPGLLSAIPALPICGMCSRQMVGGVIGWREAMGKAVPVWRELAGWAGKPLGSTGGNYQGNIDSE